jgi:hypothetical protein
MSQPLELVICPAAGIAPSLRSHLEHLLASHPDSPVWQSPEWNDMLSVSGMQQEGWYAGVHTPDGVRAYCLLEVRSVGLGLRGGFVLGGPVGDLSDGAGRLLADGLRTIARRTGLVFVQYESLSEVELPGFATGFYKRFIERSTVRLDLVDTEEEILSAMHHKGRYNIRQAEKAGVTTEAVLPTPENVGIFYELFRETTARDGFSGADRRYFAELLRLLAGTDMGELLFASLDGRVVAAGVFVYFHQAALYYYGASASDPEIRRAMPAYALQWAAIRQARSRGCRTYDFLGIEPATGGDGHLAGVTQFKRRFVPDDTTVWPEAHIMPIRPGAYALLRLARSIKKRLRRKA